MAVSLNPRAERLLTRLRTVSVYSLAELLLIILIAIQCARLFWGVLTPLGPVGDYRALDRMAAAAAPRQSLGAFDPFFRQAPGAQGPVTVTALDIRLYGISGNQATGGGSAIVSAGEGGEQRSVMVGEEIMPGVTLTAIGFDFITISRGGASEQLYLDQTPAPAPGTVPPQMQQRPAPQPVPTVTMPVQPPPAPPPAQPQPSQ